ERTLAPPVPRRNGENSPSSGRPRRVHDHGDADEADQGAGDVPPVRSEAVEGHAPEEGPGDEDASVGGEDAAEVRVRLERRDDPVEPEGEDAGADPDPAAVLAEPLPDEPRPADLEQRREDEERDRPG